MNILDIILEKKRIEVAERKALIPIEHLQQMPNYDRVCVSLVENLRSCENIGVIAEFKRKSPSKQNINLNASLFDIVTGYTSAGVSGISVLTDSEFFGGSLIDLEHARGLTHLPILRKDFIIDEYQLFEAKAHGSDVVLLIAKAITPKHCEQLSVKAKQLGLEVLLEIDSEKYIVTHLFPSIDIVGVNNRNLTTFKTDIQRSIDLVDLIPSGFLKISESGIHSVDDAKKLEDVGFKGVLMGEYFMRKKDQLSATEQFIDQLKMEYHVG